MGEVIISIKELSYSYTNGRQFAFKDINASIPAHSITSILGRNGAGKTTLLLIILGFLKTVHGTIQYYNPKSTEGQKGGIFQIAYLPQVETAPEAMSVYDYLLMGRIPYISPFMQPNKKDVNIVNYYAKIIEIDHLLDYPLGKISGGELQRVRFGRALVQESDLILLDEPITHLDLNAKQTMMRLIKYLKSLGKTIIFTTHDPVEALEIADHALLVSNDHKIKFGKATDILTDKNLSDCFNLPIRIISSGNSFGCIVEKQT